jgi:hypothetical protein
VQAIDSKHAATSDILSGLKELSAMKGQNKTVSRKYFIVSKMIKDGA